MGCGLADEHHEDHTETGRGPVGGIFSPPFLRERDLPDGPRLRMNVYEEAWERCKRRMQVRAWLSRITGLALNYAKETINELYSPFTEQVLDVVRNAYTQEEPLIACTELPTIIISGTMTAS